jgi:hypothetical protein
MQSCIWAVLLMCGQADSGNLESRTHRDGTDDKWEISFCERQVHPDGSISLRSKSVRHDGSVSYAERLYNSRGEPLKSTQEGSWGRLESTFEEQRVVRLIDGKTHSQEIERKTFADPTLFWFWKTHPQEGDSVVVSFAAANQPSSFKIRYTYQGMEEIEAAGKKIRAHKVREDPLDVAQGNEVFTIRWFDDKGMDIQRYHKVNKNEFRTKLVNWR